MSEDHPEALRVANLDCMDSVAVQETLAKTADRTADSHQQAAWLSGHGIVP